MQVPGKTQHRGADGICGLRHPSKEALWQSPMKYDTVPSCVQGLHWWGGGFKEGIMGEFSPWK